MGAQSPDSGANGKEAMGVTDRERTIAEFVAAQPSAWWGLRLPVVRHIRAALVTVRINRHYALWASFGMLALNADLDFAMRDAIWRGEK